MFRYSTWVYYIQFTSHGIRVVGVHGGKIIPSTTVRVQERVVSGGLSIYIKIPLFSSFTSKYLCFLHLHANTQPLKSWKLKFPKIR